MSSQVRAPVTRDIAVRVAGVELDLLPPADIERARHSIIDWLVAAIAGSAAEPARDLWDALEHAGTTSGPATVVGTARCASARDAALVNGVAAHTLELDDIAVLMGGHPSVSVCSSVLALAETLDASGSDTLAAVVAGYDAACRIAVALGPSHASAGWHVTGTIGTFAAAAACARLLRLEATAVESAFGLAASSAAGLSAAIGTAAKPMHAGKAAADGMLAALLAAKGAKGPENGIENYAASSSAMLDAARLDEVGDQQGIASTVFKRHACCGLLQPTVSALSRLRVDHRINAADVTRAEILVSSATLATCSFQEPQDELQGKFSIPHAAAVALAGDDTSPTAFSSAGIAQPVVAALRALVRVTEHGERSTKVSVQLRSGDVLQASEHPARPATDGELTTQLAWLREKFAIVVAPVLGISRSRRLLMAAEGLAADSSIRQLLALTRPEP